MTFNIDDSRTDLIVKLDKIIDEKLPAAEARLIKSFLEQFYLAVSPYDLRENSILDLYGALLSQWHFIYKRKPGELKLRVYNPQLEQHGWQSSHTVIEIDYENKPFILDSIRMALNRLGINIHLVIHAEGIRFIRNAKGEITDVLPLNTGGSLSNDISLAEAPIFIQIDKQSDKDILDKISAALHATLEDVDLVVRDWKAMLNRLDNDIEIIKKLSNGVIASVIEFLHWLKNDHFTFIGFAEYNYVENGDEVLEYVKGSGLGVLTDAKRQNLDRKLADMYPTAREEIKSHTILQIGKTDTLSTIHRPVYTDFVGIKIFDENGKLLRVSRFIGLYTATVYNEPASQFPYISLKIDRIFAMAGFPRNTHDGRSLLHIIENLPRDELFQAPDRDLFDIAIGILHLQERQRIKLFIRRDVYGRFFSCLVFVPRELFNSQLRAKMGKILLKELQGESESFDTKFSESVLARIQFMIRMDPKLEVNYDTARIETLLVEAARSWNDDLYQALEDHWGEEKTNELFRNYENAFPVSYKEITSARSAVMDIEHIENLKKHDDNHFETSLYRLIEDPEDSFRFKLFRNNKSIPLSDVIPILEHMGLRVMSEIPYQLNFLPDRTVWISDYHMVHPLGEAIEPDAIKDIFQDAFLAVWYGRAENDGFNKLVLSANIGWSDISVLRMYYRYMWQIGMVFSQVSAEETLNNNADIAKLLLKYFYAKFDPKLVDRNRTATITDIKSAIEAKLESVSSLNEDRVIRSYLGVMAATLRTNYFNFTNELKHKNFISMKLESGKVPDLPLPKPLYEIFVYSPFVEGIHLRGDKVARGGIRWSDRPEDFRTEILGLMKAQQVKNAVIVPQGAKGGFIVKQDLQKCIDREQRSQIVINCYKTFIRGLLDLTDNRKGDAIVKPPNAMCWDDDDPYLVVAADKGTATFSDIANSISAEYDFWLGDAFASGGSSGYDHKKMAITARGAWESVKMHFTQLNIDVQKDSITVLGIGDMAGDVFGNGMLLSDKIKLIAAFNHAHIFFDPDPDPAVSFAERQRLFAMPNSTWQDYKPELISKGGGVFPRSAKKIALSPEMKKILDCKMEHMQPNELIRAILMLKLDLFFNGGIGTFVKASSERNADVGDRANDALRINGNQVNARVVCEGGNLGFTQLARIEYAKKGGIINTDAIDNSAGVNCSDNEVNIKILLNEIIQAGDMTLKQRNQLLISMTNEVADLVLINNIKQNEAITLACYKAAGDLQMHNRLLKQLEKTAGLDPVVEFMPDIEEIAKRQTTGIGFTRPEVAILMAYTKIQLKKQIIDAELLNDIHIINDLICYFPKQLHQQKYKNFIFNHRLKNAIMATQISNYIVDEMGINFVQRLQEESGGSSAQIAASYIVSREIFDLFAIRDEIRKLGVDVNYSIKMDMMQELNRLIRRGTRWFLRNPQHKANIDEIVKKYKPLVNDVQKNIHNVLRGAWLDHMDHEKARLIKANVPEALATRASTFTAMFTALDIVTVSMQYGFELSLVTSAYFAIGSRLKLGWFGEMIKKQPVETYWDALARAAFRDELDKQQRNLTVCILKSPIVNGDDIHKRVEKWLEGHPQFVERWMFFITELKAAPSLDFTMFAVAVRELLDLTQAIFIESEI